MYVHYRPSVNHVASHSILSYCISLAESNHPGYNYSIPQYPEHHLPTKTHRHFKDPDDIVCKFLFLSGGYSEGSILLMAQLWPVLLTLDLAILLDVGHHDDGRDTLLPYQPPEVHNSRWKRTLERGGKMEEVRGHMLQERLATLSGYELVWP